MRALLSWHPPVFISPVDLGIKCFSRCGDGTSVCYQIAFHPPHMVDQSLEGAFLSRANMAQYRDVTKM